MMMVTGDCVDSHWHGSILRFSIAVFTVSVVRVVQPAMLMMMNRQAAAVITE